MRSPASKLVLVLSLVTLTGVLAGASSGDCEPEPETVVCDGNEDCPSGQVCNLFERCVDAFVAIETDDDVYAPGETVAFTVFPNGLDIEIGGEGGSPPWTVERWSNQQGRWVPLEVGTHFGCRTTGCVNGRPVELCVDPGPPWCMEHDAPFTDSWDGTHWVTSEERCGDVDIFVEYRTPAPTGSYRIVYRYGFDGRPGSATGSCSALDETVTAFFSLR